ncbi:MAG TPA: hypothetical protein VM715_12215 [Candidatus Acidoferrum sp.]|nr:hypothetical protein [Candidatus Acidoferrum sp.]
MIKIRGVDNYSIDGMVERENRSDKKKAQIEGLASYYYYYY